MQKIRNPKSKSPCLYLFQKEKNNKSTFAILLGYKSNKKLNRNQIQVRNRFGKTKKHSQNILQVLLFQCGS